MSVPWHFSESNRQRQQHAMKYSFIFLFSILILSSCSKEDDDNSPIIGTWNEYYNVTTSYDIETGEKIHVGVGGWAIIDFQSSGNAIYRYLGINYNGKYLLSDNELKLIVESDTAIYNIEELSAGRMILSKETIIQEKHLKESNLRVFCRPNYEYTEDDMKYFAPISTN